MLNHHASALMEERLSVENTAFEICFIPGRCLIVFFVSFIIAFLIGLTIGCRQSFRSWTSMKVFSSVLSRYSTGSICGMHVNVQLGSFLRFKAISLKRRTTVPKTLQLLCAGNWPQTYSSFENVAASSIHTIKQSLEK